jgi:molybdopterin-binding protein
MSKKYIQIAFSILLLAGMALGLAIKDGALAQDNPTTKLEAGLLTQLKAGPADFIVTMKEQADVSGASKLQTKVEKGQYVFDTLVATASRTQTDLRAYLDLQGVAYQSFYVINAIWVKGGSLDLAQTLGNRSDITSITSNHTYQLDPPINPQASAAEPQAVEPNISFINADDVWAMGITGQGTVMAGNDTGLDATHPAIAPHYRGCLNPPTCSEWDHNYNWYDAFAPTNVVPWDDYGHGTHTTGTMVGDDGAGNQIGVAPGAQTIHCKNMLGGGGDDAHFIICFQWDLAPWDLNGANPLPAMAPDAVNNSWGYGGGGVEAFRTVIDNLQAAGILVEVSAGNEGSGCQSLRSPGDYQEVLTTGSVDHIGQVSPGVITGFSSRGPSSLDGNYFPDIMAPGNTIRSSLPGNQYEYWSGTSMAGPHATALIGLLWSANPALRGQVNQTIDIIKETAVPLTGQNGSNCGGDYTVGPNNDWGYGMIDAQAAVQLAIAMGGSGQLDGTVTDAITGNPIEGANVHALHQDGFAWDAQTNVTGYYTMTVAAGTFEATASHPMYESSTVSDISVITDTVTTVNFELTPRGTLFGFVTDFDNGFPLVGATVTASDGQSTSTDDTGRYEIFLDEGTFVITATMEDYAAETATVDIVSGQTTQQDFALESAVAFVPSPVEITLDWETTGTLDAQLLNRQGTDYAFEFREKAVGFNPGLLGQSISTPVGSPVVPDGASNNKPIQRYTPRINQADILVLTSTDVSQSIERVLNEEGLLYDLVYVPPVTGIDFSPYSIVIMGMDGGTFSVADIQALRTGVIDAGKRLIFAGGTCWQEFATGVNDFLILNDTGNYCWTISGTPNWTLTEPSHGLADGLPDSLNFVNSSAAYYQIRVNDPLQEVVGVNGDGWPMYFYKGDYGEGDFMWMIDSAYASYWADPSDYAYFKQTMLNAINYTSSSDVPWFSEVPVSGTVPAEGSIDVSLFFTATVAAGVNQPGEYLATLTVKGTPDLEVPVSMNVLPSATMGQVKGTVTDLCTGDVLEEVLVDIPTGVPITQTMTNETGQYSLWLEEGPYNFSFSLPGYITGDYLVDVVAGQTLVQDVQLVPDRPCITEEPKVIVAYVVTGTQEFDTGGLTIGNVGAKDLTWEIREKDGGYSPGSVKAAPAATPLPAVANPGTSSVLSLPSTFGTPLIDPNSPNAWVAAAPYPQTIVRYAQAQCPGDYNSFYIIAGVSNGTLVYDTRRFDADLNTWTTLAPISGTTQENPSAVCFEGKIYATSGGYGAIDFNIYDIATDSWSTGASLPRSTEGAAMAGFDGKIYLIGGDDDYYPGNGVSDQVNIYDIATNSWSGTGAPMPIGVGNVGYVQLGQYVYVVGGWWSLLSPGSNSNLTLRYDIEGDVWEEGPAFGPAKADFPIAATSQYLYALGGDQDGGGYWDSSNTVYRYDFNAWPGGAWEDTSDPLPFAIQAMNAGFTTDSIAGGEVWSVGGLEGLSFTWHADNLYRVSEPPWSPVPTDVPWVWETPISGTITPGNTQDVDVFVSAMSDTVPLPLGTYTATLRIVNNDPVAGAQNVTVIMHIVEEYILPEASFTWTTVKVGEPTVFTNTSVAGVPPFTTFEWNFGDGTPPLVVNSWDPISHTYGTFGRFTVVLKACNDFGCSTFTKYVDVLPNVILLPFVNKN